MSSLRAVVRSAVIHEELPGPVDPRLRRAAWLGVGLLGTYAVLMYGAWSWFPPRAGGTDLPVVGPIVRFALDPGGAGPVAFKATIAAIVAALALAFATRGFRWATRVGQYAVFAVFAAGLAAGLPVLVVALALVAFVAGVVALMLLAVVAAAAVALFVLFVLVSGLDS